MTKLIILDRDGVINQDSLHYIKSVNEFILLPGSLEAIAKLTEAGYKIAIATNQSGVSRGYYDEKELDAIHQSLIQAVEKAGGSIDHIEYCTHLPEQNCLCRKPKPGMLLSISKHFHLPLTNVPFIGDRVSDVEAALAVGALPLVVLSPMTDRVGLASYPEVAVFQTLGECVDYLLQKEKAE